MTFRPSHKRATVRPKLARSQWTSGPTAYISAGLAVFFAGALTQARAEGEAASPVPETALAAARAAIKDLGEQLQAKLSAAIKAGGPAAAVGVCQTVAPAIAGEASGTHGLEVGRTALRVRNPANAPDAYERRVLEDFVRRLEAGDDPATIEHADVYVEDGVRVFRFMKAIPTAAEPCLACHGDSIAPELQAEILRLYPNDEATGFQAGELRGAFTVKKRL